MLTPSVPRIPIFGGGDAFSAQDYWSKVESSGVDGVMIARGALIKPWIFTEIKERREWDISSRERLELIRKVAFLGISPSPVVPSLTRAYRTVRRVRTRVRFTFLSSRDRFSSGLACFPLRSHFGTDTAGVNTARRYLCEALSFHYRYVPIGLLECLPPRINDRSPLFRGRDELGGCIAMLP
jgi:tRNA-dihydrouridine synthase 3